MIDETRETPERGDLQPIKSKRLMPPDWDEAEDGEWDDEYLSEKALAEGADLELVVEYLNKHLDPERTEQVRRRLEEDAAFRELAAPLVLTWSIPTHLERHPRPAGELERGWERFTKQAGFAHQRRKTRRRRLWLLGLVFFVVGAGLVGFRRPLTEWYSIQRDYVAVSLDGRQSDGWIPFGDSLFVNPAAGASLRARREPLDERLHVILDGEARFLVAHRDSVTATPFHRGLVVRTRAGTVTTEEAEFTVATRADSTTVEVHRPSKRGIEFIFARRTGVELLSDDPTEPLKLGELGRARLVRGKDQHITRLPSAKDPNVEFSIP